MGRISLFFLLSNYALAQMYSANVYGFPVAKAEYKLRADSVSLTFETVGILDMIWPTINSYSTHFDSTHFGLKSFHKKIKQDDIKQSTLMKLENSLLKYGKESQNRNDSTQTMFTMFVRIARQSQETIDTKWFNLDHEGKQMRGRFLWAGTETVKIGNTNILCDNFRMDIENIDETDGFLETTDRLMKYISDPNKVRQIWVERNGNRRIIRVTMTAYGFPYDILIDHE
ncbi:MAG: DUF3108 domain-containing protein [Candidatus Marinimicrobia bacterium]|jgi:hypothetical protein|nr:DUF3108 domain-containing protein [Candidatus Neomarinimicrobiota bacterium]MBT3675455.1 DUF3108 domain-containing protein [Candidatus Neomarinimicrobiota bacterium]MBT3762567.1 DUF3108 domain-containing protein [Candidatus Neomarinimicrobiota bacterium]MBT4067787.1 DUF3108 domain-containing protein [Candidatus Neomarinimicrobiota bacterium]MBT4271634.1 DUF3108 domain-containing protein [Candidatus Neomarinimicrobiota bacterium]